MQTTNAKCATDNCPVFVQPGHRLCNACAKASTLPAPAHTSDLLESATHVRGADDTAPHPAQDDLAVVVLVLEDGPLTAHQITGMGREALIQYIRLLEAERTSLQNVAEARNRRYPPLVRT